MQASIGYSFPKLIEGRFYGLDSDAIDKQVESHVNIERENSHLLQRGRVRAIRSTMPLQVLAYALPPACQL